MSSTPRRADVKPIRVSIIEGKPIYGGELLVKPLIKGEHMTWLEIHYAAGVGTPPHAHDHESIVYVVSGRLRATIESDVSIVGPGDICIHPPGVMHGIEAIEDSVIMECKSPAPEISGFLKSS